MSVCDTSLILFNSVASSDIMLRNNQSTITKAKHASIHLYLLLRLLFLHDWMFCFSAKLSSAQLSLHSVCSYWLQKILSAFFSSCRIWMETTPPENIFNAGGGKKNMRFDVFETDQTHQMRDNCSHRSLERPWSNERMVHLAAVWLPVSGRSKKKRPCARFPAHSCIWQSPPPRLSSCTFHLRRPCCVCVSTPWRAC